ncbi:MAG: hypothetical protein ACTHJR_18330 [Sphingomonas sp.]
MAVLSGLSQLKEAYDRDPDFFDGEDVPYDKETVALLKKMFLPKVVEKVVEVKVKEKAGRGRPSKETPLGDEDLKKLSDEIDKILKALNEMGTGEGLDPKDRINITRNKTTLLNTALQLRERLFNVKRMSEFQEIVVGILDDLVDEKGRETFLNRMEPYLTV